MSLKNYSRLVVLSIGILVGLLLIFFIVGREKVITTGLQFYLSPTDTVLRINGDVVKLNDKNQLELKAGEYEIEFVRLHFATAIQRATVSEGSITDVAVLLNPTNDEGREILEEEIEQRAREQASYRLSLQTSEAISNKTPLVTLLPVFNSDFRIDYGISQKNPDDPTAVTIFITTDSTDQRQLALDWIKSKGYDPATLEIVYRLYEEL